MNPTGPAAGPRQGPPAPPPAPPAPALNPLAMKMLAQNMKQGLPPEPQAPDPMAAAKAMLQQRAYLEKVKANSAVPAPVAPAAPAPINPLMLPKDITGPAKTLTKGMADVAALKQAEQAKAAVSSLASPLMDEAPLDVTRNPLIGKRAAALVGAANALKKYTATKEEPKPATLNSEVTADVTAPKTMADVLRNAELRASLAPKPKTIKKVAGKIQEEAPKAPEPPKAAAYEPFDPEGDPRERYPRGISAKEYGEAEAARKGKSDNARYIGNATKTAADWIRTTNLLSSKYKGYRPSFESTLHHLINIGSNVETRRAAIEHFASHVPPDISAEMRERYK